MISVNLFIKTKQRKNKEWKRKQNLKQKNKRDLFLSYTMLIIITQIFQHSIIRTMTSTTTTTTTTTHDDEKKESV